MTMEYVEPDGHVIILHFNHWFPRLLGGVNNCVTLSARHIFISQPWITARGLAHECGHIQQAKRYGWRYLLYIAWCFRKGYANSPAEIEANKYMESVHDRFQPIGAVPSWVADQ